LIEPKTQRGRDSLVVRQGLHVLSIWKISQGGHRVGDAVAVLPVFKVTIGFAFFRCWASASSGAA